MAHIRSSFLFLTAIFALASACKPGTDGDLADAGPDASPEGGTPTCTAGTRDCPCNGTACQAGLVCESATCVPATTCAEAGCVDHQTCAPNGPGNLLACTPAGCDPGFLWSSGSSACVRNVLATCSSGTSQSISVACAALFRMCSSSASGAECGACVNGYVEVGSSCIPATSCSQLDCASANRTCSEVAGTASCGTCLSGYQEDASAGTCIANAACATCDSQNRTCMADASGVSCGGCITGYVVDGATCQPFVLCADLSCAAEHRTCSESPNGHCLDACVSGFVWDSGTSSCRPPRTCAQITACQSGESCVEATQTMDAFCSSGLCSNGTGRDPSSGDCLPCSGGAINATCVGTGFEPERLRDPSGVCFCKSEDDYFIDIGTANYDAVPCDADQDGWVTARAITAYSTQTRQSLPLIAQNARCDVHVVDELELINDQSDGPHIVSIDPLPLYESERNDGDPAAAPSLNDPVRMIPFNVLNSFTKACVVPAPLGDANGNGLADVHEGGAHATSFSQSDRKTYFDRYVRYSYYLELNDGYFVEDSMDGVGRYRVLERARIEQDATPQRFPFDLGTAPGPFGDYWAQCRRQTDRDDVPGVAQSNGNSDFVEFASTPMTGSWGGMNHVSQFKCVHVINEAVYDSMGSPSGTAASLESHPQIMWLNGSTLGRTSRSSGSTDVASAWTPFACSATGQSYKLGNGRNPTHPSVACSPVAASSLHSTGQAWTGWVAVGYENTQSSVVAWPTSPYQRGCINECVVDGIDDCPGWGVNGNRSLYCVMNDTTNYGHLQCHSGCGAESVSINGPLQVCGHMVGAGLSGSPSGPTLISADLRLRGSVDLSGFGPVVDTSGVQASQPSLVCSQSCGAAVSISLRPR